MTTSPAPGRARLQALLEWALVAVGAAVYALIVVHGIWGDGAIRFSRLIALMEHGALSPEPPPYSLIGPLLAAPLYLLGKLAGTPYDWARHFNLIFFALGLLAFALLLRGRVAPGVLRRFVLVMVAASMFPNHTVMSFYMELASALLVAVGILAAELGRPGLGWGLAAVGAANTPALLVPLGLVCAARALDGRRLRALVPVLVGAALFAAENWIRYGGPLANQYADIVPLRNFLPTSGKAGFSYPLLFGLIGTLVSAGKGLLFFIPALFLPIGASRRELVGEQVARTYRLWILFSVGLVLVYAKWWAWSGDWFWGPRFQLFACVPASLALAVRLCAPERDGPAGRVLTLLALVLSCWVAANGALYGTQNGVMGLCQGPNNLDAVCRFIPEFSVLWRPFTIDEGMDAPRALGLAYFGAVALALGAPLAFRLAADAVRWVRSRLPDYAPAKWRW